MIRRISRYEWSVVEPGVDTIYYGTSGMQHGDLHHTTLASFLPALAFLVFQTVIIIRQYNQPNKTRHSSPDRAESK
ncbi:hypothetical protein N9I65_03005 [bacterium]|nr:hypothetical protein [bacterium]